ncbi:Predicted arabinose efflux permease, MFS family [Paraburkholderia fungorum]|uniref:Predicted arabinose efflux permease, MFS family n=1 Tax=Paraburkholderia fungorum TaxID=134537 RepID=A0A1H1JXT7_9BURK|nr:MFS transporter [Paraburkholderia fungorum]SDR54736.1 Predicted arabinose efflux permease, MFS family [Paraburkholderia fungorum]
MEPNVVVSHAAQPADTGASRGFTKGSVVALMIAHCAGMVDLVALPVWVATLIGAYRLDAQRAGALPTLFLAGVVASSIICSPLLARLRGRGAVPIGFATAAIAFFYAGTVQSYALMALLHLVAGLAVGCSLSITHGTIGHSANPHRLFAFAGLSLGGFSIVFLGLTPVLISTRGGIAFFGAVAASMALAALVCAIVFPAAQPQTISTRTMSPLAWPVWFCIAGVSCMAMTQAMLASFIARIGTEDGFSVAAVTSVLIALGLVNLLPAPLAAVLQRRVDARLVVLIGPFVQAVLALVISQSRAFVFYAVATAAFPAVMIFCHTFAFGLLARLDNSGRATAATPAMLMTGAAIGPLLGGTLVRFYGHGSLGFAAIGVGAVAFLCFFQIPRQIAPKSPTP